MSMTLCDYFLLKEVIKVTGLSISFYLNNHKDKIKILRHNRYIRRDAIKFSDREKLTDLYNHIPLKLFAEHVNISKGPLEQRVDFMKKHKDIELFKYNEVQDILFVVVEDDLKDCLNKFTPFIILLKHDYTKYNIKTCKTFATYTIGFY